MKPVLASIGRINIYSWGVAFAIAFIAGLLLSLRAARRRGVNDDRIFDLVIIVAISGLLGARLLYVALEWQYYAGDVLGMLSFWEGGLSWYGGLLGALVAGWLYCRVTKFSFWQAADVLAAPLALAYAIVRIGCFLNGCCYGHETTLPVGVRFPGLDGPRHPTQLYSSLAGLVIFGLVTLAERRQKFTGQLFLEFLAYYSLYRFIVEFWRVGEPFWGPFDVTQPLAFLGFVVFSSVVLVLISEAKHNKAGDGV
ncbi:MAG: prolipoprotein diacylglyceryl transferase [Chloroflexota bacterium]